MILRTRAVPIPAVRMLNVEKEPEQALALAFRNTLETLTSDAVPSACSIRTAIAHSPA